MNVFNSTCGRRRSRKARLRKKQNNCLSYSKNSLLTVGSAFGAEPTVEMLATAENDHLAELKEELRKCGLPHVTLFKTASWQHEARSSKKTSIDACSRSVAQRATLARRGLLQGKFPRCPTGWTRRSTLCFAASACAKGSTSCRAPGALKRDGEGVPRQYAGCGDCEMR